jgi:hypothetical protein
MTITLREHSDSMLYIVDEMPLFDEPKMIVSWWPLGMKAYQFKRDYGAEFIGQAMIPDSNCGSGRYTGDRDNLVYQLVNGGETRATYSETVDIPVPKTSKEVLWRNGRWEKRLAKGWVPI